MNKLLTFLSDFPTPSPVRMLIFHATQNFIYLTNIALPVVPILSQINPFHNLPPYSCKFYFNIILPTMPKSSNSHISFGFSNRKYQLI